jgi:hypothetical protein
VKTLTHPSTGKIVKFGRKHPHAIGPHLRLSNYLRMSAVVAAPPAADYSKPAASVLADIMGNDQLGDCVIAGGYHVTGVETGNAGSPFHATLTQVVADYGKIGGYVPGDTSTDNGCNLQDALNYWTAHGFANGTKLVAWLAVDATSPDEVRAACYLFENLYMGMALPDAWVSPFPSGDGFTWDVAGAPDPSNGHCVMAMGYDTAGVKIDTWGMLGTLTYAALAKYAANANGGELYVMLTPDQLAKGQTKAPNGIDWSTLIADWNAMGGTVPVAPPVVAPPAPAGGPVTLAEATSWAACALQNGHHVMTRSQAIALVTNGLAASWPTQ